MSGIIQEEKEFTLEDIVGFITKHWKTFLVFMIISVLIAAYKYKTNVSFTAKSVLLFQNQNSSPLQTISANISGVNLDSYWSEDKLEHHMLYLETPSFYRFISADIMKREKYRNMIMTLMGQNFFAFLSQFEGTGNYSYRFDQAAEKMAITLWGMSTVKKVGPNSMSFSVSHERKSLAVDLANLFADYAVKKISSQYIDEIDEVQAFFNKQIEQAEADMENLDNILLSLQRKMTTSSPGSEKYHFLEAQQKLKEELSRAQVELNKNKKVIEAFGELPSARRPTSEALSSDKFTAHAQVELLKNENEVIAARIDAINELLADLEKSTAKNSKVEISIERLKRKLGFKSDFVMDLVSQSVRMEVMRISLKNKVILLERALLARATRDGNLRNSALAASGAGAVLAFIFILVMNIFNPIIRDEKEMIGLNMIPLGKVPDFTVHKSKFFSLKKYPSLLLSFLGRLGPMVEKLKFIPPLNFLWRQIEPIIRANQYAESHGGIQNVFISKDISKISLDNPEAQVFRHLRARFLSAQNKVSGRGRVISVLSPSVGAGKSFVAASFAGALAHLGKRTIIIDCDVKNPTISGLARLKTKSGLIEVLDDTNSVALKEFIHTLPVGLDVLPAGTCHNRVPELLSSDPVNELLESLVQHYDYVILDLPPMSKVAESVYLSRHSDFVMMVVTMSYSKYNELEGTLEILRANGQHNIGCVLNKSGRPGEYGYFARPESRFEDAS